MLKQSIPAPAPYLVLLSSSIPPLQPLQRCRQLLPQLCSLALPGGCLPCCRRSRCRRWQRRRPSLQHGGSRPVDFLLLEQVSQLIALPLHLCSQPGIVCLQLSLHPLPCAQALCHSRCRLLPPPLRICRRFLRGALGGLQRGIVCLQAGSRIGRDAAIRCQLLREAGSGGLVPRRRRLQGCDPGVSLLQARLKLALHTLAVFLQKGRGNAVAHIT